MSAYMSFTDAIHQESTIYVQIHVYIYMSAYMSFTDAIHMLKKYTYVYALTYINIYI